MKISAFAIINMFLTFLGLGVKFFRWGKNSLGGVKIHQMVTSETVQCVGSNSWHLQFLHISLPESALYMTLKRRAEISADIFARLLWYFRLPWKNLTIICAHGIFWDERQVSTLYHGSIQVLLLSPLVKY